MASFTIEIGGKNNLRKIKRTIRRLTPEFQNVFLDEAGEFGKKAVSFNVPIGARPSGLNRAVIHHRVTKTEEIVRFANPQQQIIANFNEFGVREHHRSLSRDPELKRWALMKIPEFVAKGGDLLRIGGKNSRIRLGQSSNKFIDRSVNDIVNNIDLITKKTWDRIKNKT